MQTKPQSFSNVNGWCRLDEELDRWNHAGLTATFWWRDDDAAKDTPALKRLFRASENACAPLLLAVIPLAADAGLADAVKDNNMIRAGQHGYAHVNHAPRGRGDGAWELGMHRGRQAVLDDLARGFDILSGLFGNWFIPVAVPPWNRIDPQLYPDMAQIGYRGVSAFGPVDPAAATSNLVQVNCHCDPIKWKDQARFTGEDKTMAMICEHLEYRRTDKADPEACTGLLTHHLDMDEEAWSFVTRLAKRIHRHPAARWRHPDTLFKAAQ